MNFDVCIIGSGPIGLCCAIEAKKNNLKLADCYSLIPKEESNFVDHIHFSPEGMKLLAKSVAEKIKI